MQRHSGQARALYVYRRMGHNLVGVSRRDLQLGEDANGIEYLPFIMGVSLVRCYVW